MGKKIVVGPQNRGLRKDVSAFNIDDDSFPTLTNAYQWRGKIKRKRGTAFLARLTRFFNSVLPSYPGPSTFALSGGAGNLFTGFGLEASGNIVPGSVSILSGVYTDPDMDGTLTGGLGGTINYATGDITIVAGGSTSISASFRYYPDLPVMGLEDLTLNSNDFPTNLSFDTVYSYVITPTDPADVYDVSFYKNPTTGTYSGYTQKVNSTPVRWNGEDYQQFWTVNYQGALWATNGVTTPFSVTNIGMPFKPIVSVTVLTPTTVTLAIPNHGLFLGDFIFVNEVVTTIGINFQTGFVTSVVTNVSVNVTFPNATIVGNGTGGIAQYLTRRSDLTKDCIRWYDGDPTNGSATAPALTGFKGWVNFCPPLSEFSYSIADLPARQYYLVGAKMIVPFKDRLCFFAPVVQASTGNPIYLKDTVVYSQNGTPYYTASFTGDPSLPTTEFHPILVPEDQTATASAYFGDQTGFGGWISAGVDQEITTVESNEDVQIVGFPRRQSRFVYTGNDVLPFNFFDINTELGSGSTFSAINMNKGVLSKGSRGYIITSQVGSQRIDEEIPDQVFQTKLTENGSQRVCAQRDYINEWVYFTYPSNKSDQVEYRFPNQTLLYNYRDSSWAIFDECYTTYGLFRTHEGFTWSTLPYKSWREWNDPWDSGESTLLNPDNIAGNQQGFVLKKDEGTGESHSLYIQNISGNTVTSPDHCLNRNDFIYITDAIGTVSTEVNNKVFSIYNVTQNTFDISPNLLGTGTYLGLGNITRIYIPYIQTKQFPIFWDMARKTRIGTQQYLLTTTTDSQITLLIFLSQNADFAYNNNAALPNDSLIYSTVLYTCPESTNLGLTPANINLNMVTAESQAQIWHRINTSLIGDTVQVGFTLSKEQVRELDVTGYPKNAFAEIEIHGFILDCSPSMSLS